MNEKKTPRIRFKGFTDDWEQRKLSDVAGSVDTGKSKFDKEGSSGEYPILGSTSVIGYDDEYDYEGDFILTARVGANAGSLYRHAGKVKISDNTVFIQASQNIEFLYQLLIRFDIKRLSFGTGQPLVKASELKRLELMMPTDMEEQMRIGVYFKNLDNLITLHQRKYEKLQIIKKSMLENCFPKNGEKVPRIRFAGFTGDWEQRKLGDFCEMFNGDRGINYPKDSDMVQAGIPFVNAGDLQEGKVNLATANKITREKFDQLGGAKIKRGDILYCLRGTLGKNAFVDNFDEGTVASSLVDIRPKNVDSQYLFTVLNSDIEYRQRILSDEGAAQPNLSARNLANFDIPVPKIEEQVKIGRYFESLSNLITLHQSKLEKLQKIKKSLLERMFA